MTNGNVGASLLSIITESLYDKPMVVFREYVQNSVDSLDKVVDEDNKKHLHCKIWTENNNLFFLDNGIGIQKDGFWDKMRDIGFSEKKKSENIGYKGIGRLSGLPYCKKLIFINILSYKNNSFQKYVLNGEKYNEIKNQLNFNELEYYGLIDQIGTYAPGISDHTELSDIKSLLEPYKDIFVEQDTGFLVILWSISRILALTIQHDTFETELGWLLPVKFRDELFESHIGVLFKEITDNNTNESSIIPAKAYNISYNNRQLERPISPSMLRYYTCKVKFLDYAVGFHTFDRQAIAIDKKNEFKGIKLYIDNMLLCDETELIPQLQKYNLIGHTSNELIQAVRGLGAIIYITDKINISANARRTFIEATDRQSIEFLLLLAEFISNIYKARYALSRYRNRKKIFGEKEETLNKIKKEAIEALQTLAMEEITIDFEDEQQQTFYDKSEIEQKQIIKKRLTKYLDDKIKEYLLLTNTFDYDNAVSDFQKWLSSNY